MTDPNPILIIGAGIAGPVSAFFLARAGFRVTVVERASKLPTYGQGLDIEGPAREIVQKMEVWEDFQACATGEEGLAMVNDRGENVAVVPNILTSDVEVMRGDMVRILCAAAEKEGRGEVVFRYGTTVKSIDELHDSGFVSVKFASGSSQHYHAIIAADGVHSPTRALVFGSEASAALRPRDHYAAYFSLPAHPSDSPYSRVQNATNGRSCLIRPINSAHSSAYIWQRAASPALEAATRASRSEQKAALAKAFSDMGGLAPRLVAAMQEASDFYFERLTQVHLPAWSAGRCILVGDAAHAGTPLTGQSAHLAILGAYVLAGEISRTPNDIPGAAKRYEERLREYVEKTQEIPAWGPKVANPESWLGVVGLRMLYRSIAWSGAWNWFPARSHPFDLPVYAAFEDKGESVGE